jgi:hypothetical protein
MASGFPPGPRRNRFIRVTTLLLGGLAFWGCGGGGSGPDEDSGLVRISAADLDHGSPDLAGFGEEDLTSYRIRVLAGPREVVDSTFVKAGAIQHEFELAPNTYFVEVQGFQSEDVMVLEGAGQVTVAPGDTVPLAIDLDPTIGDIDLTIGGETTAVVATNGSAPVQVTVRNKQGRAVDGADVEIEVEPAAAGSITFDGPALTGSDGTLSGLFVPAGGEFTGELELVVDGFPIDFTPPRSFSIVSPVDTGLSTLTLTNTFRLPADGVSQTDISVLVVDRRGEPQANIPVVVRSNRNNGAETLDRIRSDQAKTDASGQFTATLTTHSSSNLAGDATITAEADGKTLADRGTVNFLSIVSATASEARIAPQLVPADGSSFAEVTVTVRGNAGQRLANVLVQIETKDNSLFKLQPASGRTDSNGTFRSRISSTVKTGTVVDVFADGLKTSAVGFVLFN